MQEGGRPLPSNRDAIPQYSSMDEYMSQSPYERGGSGGVENTFGPMDYIAGAFPIGRALAPAARAVGRALGLGQKAAPKPTPIPRQPVTYNEMGPQLLQNRFDDALQYRAGRALNEAATEDLASQLNVQRQAMDVIDDMNIQGSMDNISYQKFMRDLENLFNTNPGGEKFTAPLVDLMEEYGIDITASSAQKLANSMRPFQMNREGGKIPYKIIKR